MNIQLKRGLTDVCVLAALRNEDSYGYKIISDLSDVMTMSESTLYPVLKRLEEKGCLKTFSKDYNGRLRKYYEITNDGIFKISEFMDEWDELVKVGKFIESKGVFRNV